MSKYKKYTNAEIIAKTRDTVYNFYKRHLDSSKQNMADNFMWIGSNDFQWAESLEEFVKMTEAESQEPPVQLSEEEFHILIHEKNVWVIYGRYTANVLLDDGTLLHAKVRGTYVWKQFDNEVKLIHIHRSHSQDIPIQLPAPIRQPFNGETGFFEYLKGIDYQAIGTSKIPFRDRSNNHHFLFPAEILYLKAGRQWCTVFTKNGSFDVRGGISEHEASLNGNFLRIHKSYLVNTQHVSTICRYHASLRSGEELPIGKERYMNIRKQLQLPKIPI